MKNALICLILIVPFFISCSPATKRTTFVSRPPNTATHPIKIFSNKTPKCEYEELGIVSSRQRNKFISMDSVMESLKEEARAIGGDAIIGLSQGSEQRSIHSTGTSSYQTHTIDNDPVLTGTVIRFVDSACVNHTE